MTDARETVCGKCELPWLVCGCAPGEAKPVPVAVPADVKERGEPNCDLCDTGRVEEECGNGFSEWVCDSCGHASIEMYDDDDDLHRPEEPLLRVNLIDAAKLR